MRIATQEKQEQEQVLDTKKSIIFQWQLRKKPDKEIDRLALHMR